ncbi:MAG: hypothetical protein JWQ38_563 [Flavipsychrobacter sp.]|nr:hypothetical protein [Flavipsychrobacter sp.]
MNNSFKVIVAAIGLSAASAASAAVVTPTSIARTADMDFGRITTIRDAVIKPAAAAKFTVSGLPFFTYTITLPRQATLSDNRTHTMNISSFISTPATNGTLNAEGNQVLNVAAMLNVAAKQPSGTYTNTADVAITINYN